MTAEFILFRFLVFIQRGGIHPAKIRDKKIFLRFLFLTRK